MNDSAQNRSTSSTHRVGGRLHVVNQVRDKAGNLISTVTRPLKVEFKLTDFFQLIAGATVLALPVSLTEEVWNLGGELSMTRSLVILAVSVITLAGFIWALFYGQRLPDYPDEFVKRCISAYLVAFAVALILLTLFDKAPLDDLALTLKRTIIVAFPASFAATAVDFMK
jgi:uncharacterized membrane protein